MQVNIQIDEASWAANPNLGAFQDGSDYVFALKGETNVIRARIDGSNIALFPERSSAQKRLQTALQATPSA